MKREGEEEWDKRERRVEEGGGRVSGIRGEGGLKRGRRHRKVGNKREGGLRRRRETGRLGIRGKED